MKDNLFETWLKTVDGRPGRQASDNLSRVRRVERAGCDIDAEYEKDHCASILNSLYPDTITRLNRLELPADSDGLSSLRTAVKKYVRFREGLSD